MARTGRRRGKPDTREAILVAARDVFSQVGFDGASVRSIAAAAGVDPALVHHYFGTKDKLFLAAVEAPIDPALILGEVLDGNLAHVGERLVTAFLRVWDDPVAGQAAVALFRSALRHDFSARMLREFITAQVLRKVIAALPVDQPALRASLVGSQMFGLIGVRYLLRIEPLASAPPEVVVAALAPTVQRYLTGPDVFPASAPGRTAAEPVPVAD